MALVDRTEGWAAGLRLAALPLAGHPDPERFAAEFSGTERTVVEYLLARQRPSAHGPSAVRNHPNRALAAPPDGGQAPNESSPEWEEFHHEAP